MKRKYNIKKKENDIRNVKKKKDPKTKCIRLKAQRKEMWGKINFINKTIRTHKENSKGKW